MIAIASNRWRATGQGGYEHIYHVFLPPGTDVCFNNPDGSVSGTCYSPDNLATFYFCAYHGSFDILDSGGHVISHVLYTVEPYQNVAGCQVAPGSPNGTLIDSTDTVLAHETFETITDPDGDAWIDVTSNGMFGQEIADECEFVFFTPTATATFYFFDVPYFYIGTRKYGVQRMWSNSQGACSTAPPLSY